MAEAALAIAIDPNTSPWSSVRLDPEALADREWMEVGEAGTELVSCGPPVLHTEVRTTGDTPLGELEIRSPSLLSGYVGAPSPLTTDGWLHTADLGYVREGEVFIAGRTDDVLIVAGRNIDARALDEAAGGHPACRPGNAACFPDGSGRYVVVAEPRTAMTPEELRSGHARSAFALARRFGATRRLSSSSSAARFPRRPAAKCAGTTSTRCGTRASCSRSSRADHPRA